jgi:hypothetical protein
MNDAEVLLDIADSVIIPKNRLLVFEGVPPNIGDLVALALALKKRPDVALQAAVEGWKLVRIVRELY